MAPQPAFAPPPENIGAVASVLAEPTATIPLHKLAPEAALRRLELTIVRRLEGFLHGDHHGPAAGTRFGHQRRPDATSLARTTSARSTGR